MVTRMIKGQERQDKTGRKGKCGPVWYVHPGNHKTKIPETIAMDIITRKSPLDPDTSVFYFTAMIHTKISVEISTVTSIRPCTSKYVIPPARSIAV